jgi:phage-related protein
MAVAIPTFPSGNWNIDVETANEVSFAILENTFGDGYVQRATDGLNSNRDSWNATFTNLTDAEATLLFNFIRERAGYKPFYWQAPGDVTIKQWTARDLKRQPTGVSNNLAYWKISCTLKEEFGSTIEVKTPVFVTGVGAVGQVGTIKGNSPAVQLFGVVGTGAAGVVTPSKVTIIGAVGTGSAGIILGSNSRLIGVRADGIAGNLT